MQPVTQIEKQFKSALYVIAPWAEAQPQEDFKKAQEKEIVGRSTFTDQASGKVNEVRKATL
jgi:hypothetical protein